MGILSRLNRVIKSNLNALVDHAEDPDKMIGQTVTDMKTALKKARQELVQTMGTAKRLENRQRELEDERSEWEKKAVLALENGDEDLAREALKRKRRATKDTQSVRERAAREAASAEDMKLTLERIEEKIEDLGARQTSLAAQVRQARDNAADPALTGNGRLGGGAFEDLERMADRMDQLDAEVEAHGLLDDPKRAEVNARFAELTKEGNDDEIEDELSALKAKLQG